MTSPIRLRPGAYYHIYNRGTNRENIFREERNYSLFEHPFDLIEVHDPICFARLVAYIHQNPQKHKLVPDFREWKYSSYHALVTSAPTRLQRETVIGWFDTRANFVAVHEQHGMEAALESLTPNDFD